MVGFGNRFENDLTKSFVHLFTKKGESGVFKNMVGTEMDKFHGVDFILWGIPMDVTVNPDKDHVEWSNQEVTLLNGTSVKFGVRTGNSHNGFTRFEQPVLVLHINCFYGNIFELEDAIVEAMSKKIDEIVDAASDVYYDFIDRESA